MRRLLALLCLAALVGCGTTVPISQGDVAAQTGVAGDTGLALAGSEPATAGAGGQAPGSAAATGGGAVSAGGTAAGAAGSSGVGTAGTAAGAPGTKAAGDSARGVTASTIKIGIPIATGMEGVANSFGVEGGGTISPRAAFKAAIGEVNTSGGVLGRKIDPVFHEFDAASGIANPERTVAAICSDYRDDRPVFAVVFDVTLPSLRKCLAEMGSPLLVLGGFTVMPTAAYGEYGGSFLYGINTITTERLAELFIASLMQRSFHEPWDTTAGGPGVAPVKLGVIHVDTPDQNALYASYARELAKHGLQFEETATYPQNAHDGVSATQSAVLKFRSEGVTHVYGASVFFLQAAESQGYRPRYAYLPGLGTLGASNAPPAQMRGALTVGWTPMSDVSRAQDPGDTPGAKRCRAVMKSEGLESGNRDDQKMMFGVCDAVFSLRAALAAGRLPTVANLRRGFEALGTRLATALTFGAALAPGRHNGVNSVRDMAYDSKCSCLKYTSKTDRR